jgi:hypothetical protein
MRREVVTCDVCERELPLSGVRGQVVREVKRTWRWPSFRPESWEPDHICEDCWGGMVEAARDARKEAGLAV